MGTHGSNRPAPASARAHSRNFSIAFDHAPEPAAKPPAAVLPRGGQVSAIPCIRPGVLPRSAIPLPQKILYADMLPREVVRQKANGCGIREKAAIIVESPARRSSRSATPKGKASVTGLELKQLRQDLGDALGRPLSAADMAKLCGLEPKEGADTIRRWEVTGPSGPAGKLLTILAMASDRHPILENFNIFDRWDVHERERPALREAFREKMRNEIRERLA